MRKAVLVLVALLAATAFAQTTQTENTPAQPVPRQQNGRRGPASVDQRIAFLARRFQLTDEQQQKVRPLVQHQMEQAQSIRADNSLAPQQKQQKLMDLRRDTRTQMESLLTPQQRALAGGGNNGMGANGAPGAGVSNDAMGAHGAPGARAMNWLDSRVKLTDEQKGKLQPMFAERQQQAQAIRQDTSLTPEQKRDKLRQLGRESQQKMLAVLTPDDQQRQLQQARRPGAQTSAPPANGKEQE